MRQYMEGVGLAFRESETSPYCLEKDVNISKFLNRILGLPVYAQNTLFQYFSDTLKAVVDEAKRDGRYDMGIMGKFYVFMFCYQEGYIFGLDAFLN